MSLDTPYCRECKQHVSTAGGLLTDSFFICAACLHKTCDEPLKIAPGGKCTFLLGHDGPHSWAALPQCEDVQARRRCSLPFGHLNEHSYGVLLCDDVTYVQRDGDKLGLFCGLPAGHGGFHSGERDGVGKVQWAPLPEGPAQSEWGYAFRGPASSYGAYLAAKGGRPDGPTHCSRHPQCMLPKDHVGLCTASSAPIYPVSTPCLQTYYWPSQDGSRGKASFCTKSEGHEGVHSFNAPDGPVSAEPPPCGEPFKDTSVCCSKPLGHDGPHTGGNERLGTFTWDTAPIGAKFDAGKMDWSLLPWDGLESVVRVLQFGERKYARDGWRKVPDSTNRYRKALLRHVIAWCSGIEVDEETGESHLAHACCCILFILGKRETP